MVMNKTSGEYLKDNKLYCPRCHKYKPILSFYYREGSHEDYREVCDECMEEIRKYYGDYRHYSQTSDRIGGGKNGRK